MSPAARADEAILTSKARKRTILIEEYEKEIGEGQNLNWGHKGEWIRSVSKIMLK